MGSRIKNSSVTKLFYVLQDNMLGIVQSLKDFMQRVSPTDTSKEPFVSYKTSKTKVHYYETPSGIVFVLTTDPSVGDIRNILQELHKTVRIFSHVDADHRVHELHELHERF